MPQDSKAGRADIPSFQTNSPNGVNWLLVIAIDKYKHCAPLNNCVKDAKAIVKVLTEKYQFEKVEELYDANANRKNILAKLNELQSKVRPAVDNLLIYFSGHGETEGEDGDEDEQIGYLVPVEAAKGDENDYLPHSFFKEKLNRIKTKHTFVIMDACFSGSFFIKIKSDKRSGAENNASRWGFSSSLSHEVALDGKPGDNSPFAQCLLETLEENDDSFGIHGLAEAVGKKMLQRKAKQTPVCLPFSDPNKYKGQFFFHPAKNEAQLWATTEATDTADAYHAFWQQHPDSPHAEDALWRYACKNNQLSDYQLYRKHYPQGAHRFEVFDKMDDATFAQCRTVKDFQNYLNTFGDDANHADEAHAKIDALLGGIVFKTPAPTIIIPEAPAIILPEPSPLGGGGLEPEMVFVQGGTFKMGSNEYSSEKPIHEVTLRDFYIGKYPVTFEEYDAFCDATKRKKNDDKDWGRGKHPVIFVDWHDARDYAQWLSKQSGKHYRLPTEAEWEYAARGGNQSKGYQYAGSNNLDEVGWYNGNSNSKTHPVGEKKANELGIHDMSGNVWEWCADVWHDNYKDAPKDGSAWMSGGDQDRRVLRGGSWTSVDNYCRVAVRNWDDPNNRDYSVGFRLAQD